MSQYGSDCCCYHRNRRYIRILSEEPFTLVSVEELKEHARIFEDCDDGMIAGLVLAATQWIEKFTRRTLTEKQYRLSMSCFPGCKDTTIDLPGLVVQSLDDLEYTDQDGTVRSLLLGDITPRTVFTDSDAKVMPEEFRGSWPSTYPAEAAEPDENVKVTYTAGYTAQTVPEPIRVAIKMMATHLYEHPEAVTSEQLEETPMGVKMLLSSYRDGRMILGSVTDPGSSRATR